MGTAPAGSRGAEPRGVQQPRGEPARCGQQCLGPSWIPSPSCPKHVQSSLVGESGGSRGRCVAGSGC